MESLKKLYIIVKPYEHYLSHMTDFISFDKVEIDIKCKKLNDEFCSKTPLYHSYGCSDWYIVLTMEEAIK